MQNQQDLFNVRLYFTPQTSNQAETISQLHVKSSYQLTFNLIFLVANNHTWLSLLQVLPWWLSGKESTCKCRRLKFDSWVRKIPWRRKWQPTIVFLPGKSHGQRSLAGYVHCVAKKQENLATKPPPSSYFYFCIFHYMSGLYLFICFYTIGLQQYSAFQSNIIHHKRTS